MIGKTLDVEFYNGNMPKSVLSELDHLIESLNEPFDWYNAEYFIFGRSEKKLVGVVVYGKSDKYARFLHIILSPEFKRTKLAYKLLAQSEEELLKRRFQQIVVYIRFDLPSREMKKKYALKWHYKKYNEDKNGEFFYKTIGGKLCVAENQR